MRVAEKFISINGEGTRAGELAVFVRFTGCNLRCSYCDTMWANEPGCPYEEMSPAQICDYVYHGLRRPCRNRDQRRGGLEALHEASRGQTGVHDGLQASVQRI